jgi:hypothetical protein
VILKLLVSAIFAGAAVQKFTGKVVFWWPGLELVGAGFLGAVLLGALATLIRHREGPSHIALTAFTLFLVIAQLYRSTVA